MSHSTSLAWTNFTTSNVRYREMGTRLLNRIRNVIRLDRTSDDVVADTKGTYLSDGENVNVSRLTVLVPGEFVLRCPDGKPDRRDGTERANAEQDEHNNAIDKPFHI